jgi:hypothetical protein
MEEKTMLINKQSLELPDRRELIEALRFFRQQHPEYSAVKSVHHGFYGWCVFATYNFERRCVGQVMKDVVEPYRKAQATGKDGEK